MGRREPGTDQNNGVCKGPVGRTEGKPASLEHNEEKEKGSESRSHTLRGFAGVSEALSLRSRNNGKTSKEFSRRVTRSFVLRTRTLPGGGFCVLCLVTVLTLRQAGLHQGNRQRLSTLWASGSPSVVPRPRASVSPGNFKFSGPAPSY